MIEILNAAQGLTTGGKSLISVVVLSISVTLLFLLWQSPKSDSLKASPVPTTTPRASLAGAPVLRERPDAATRRSPVNKTKPSAKTLKPVAEASAEHEKPEIGNVTSNNQSGGITAGYIGSVRQE